MITKLKETSKREKEREREREREEEEKRYPRMEKIFLSSIRKIRDIRENEPRNHTMHNGFSSLQSEIEFEGLEVGRVLDTSRDTYEIFMELYEFTPFVIVNRRWNGGDIGRRFTPHRKSCFREGMQIVDSTRNVALVLNRISDKFWETRGDGLQINHGIKRGDGNKISRLLVSNLER